MSLITVPNHPAPNEYVFADTHNDNFKTITNALSGLLDGFEFLFDFNGANPVLKLNQTGGGSLLICNLSTTQKVSIQNNGQLISTVPTGDAPFIIADPLVVTGLNVSRWDNLTSAEILKLAGGTLTGFLTTHADPNANMKLANKQYVDSKSFFPSGTKILFGTEPPSGWTRVNVGEDRVIKLAVAAESAGDVNGTWNLTGALFFDDFTLSLGHLPSHNHTFTYSQTNNLSGPGATPIISSIGIGGNNANTGNAGSTNAHNHSSIGDSSWRPAYRIWCGATRN